MIRIENSSQANLGWSFQLNIRKAPWRVIFARARNNPAWGEGENADKEGSLIGS
jgi:hypothetical protein